MEFSSCLDNEKYIFGVNGICENGLWNLNAVVFAFANNNEKTTKHDGVHQHLIYLHYS